METRLIVTLAGLALAGAIGTATGKLLRGGCVAGAGLLHRTRHSIRVLFFASLVAIPVVPVAAQELPPPPYLISRGEFVVVGIAYDESRAKRLAPGGLQMAPGATGVIIMYTAGESYGLPAYSSAWMGLDVEGFDAPSGQKARWMLTGLYSPGSVTTALAKYFDYPTREGSTRLERDGARVVAVATMGGREMIRVELTLKPEPCQRASGLGHEVTRKGNAGPVQLIKIPFVGDWCTAESTKVDVSAPASDPFGQLSPVKVVWAGYLYGGFGWTPPVTR
jgi:hypothetical protein